MSDVAAPVASAAPATPAAPVAPQSASAQLNQTDAAFMKAFGMEGMLAAPAEAPAPAKPVLETAAPVGETPVVDAKAETPAEVPAEDVEAPAPEKPKRELLAEFKAFEDGEALDAHQVADVEIEYQANGKTHKEPLDKVIRLAQMGRYNEEREQKVVQTQQQNEQLSSHLEQAAQYIAAQQADLQAMFSDASGETFLLALAEYQKTNAPEAQVERLRRENEELRTRGAREAEGQRVQSFISDSLTPKLAALVEQHGEVPFEEAFGRFNVLIAPLLRAGNGRVSPADLPKVAQLIDGELTPWVQQLHESRAGNKASAKAEAEKREKAQKTETHLAKRKLARATSPSTVGGAPLREAPKPKTYTKATDILDDIGNLVQQSVA